MHLLLLTSRLICRAIAINDGYLVAVERSVGTPLVVAALSADTLSSLVKVIDELSLIVLAANDSFLCACHAGSEHALSWSCVLW